MTCFVVLFCRGEIGGFVARLAWPSMVLLLKGQAGGIFEDMLDCSMGFGVGLSLGSGLLVSIRWRA